MGLAIGQLQASSWLVVALVMVIGSSVFGM